MGRRRATEQRKEAFLDSPRHIILSSAGGIITEFELAGEVAGSGDVYIIRYHVASQDASTVLEAGSWIGFRYRDAHWSFVKQVD